MNVSALIFNVSNASNGTRSQKVVTPHIGRSVRYICVSFAIFFVIKCKELDQKVSNLTDAAAQRRFCYLRRVSCFWDFNGFCRRNTCPMSMYCFLSGVTVIGTSAI